MAWTATTKIIIGVSIVAFAILVTILGISFSKSIEKENSPENVETNASCKKKDYLLTPILAAVLVGICLVSLVIMFILGFLQSKELKKAAAQNFANSPKADNFKMGIYISLFYFIGAGAVALLMYFLTLAFY